MSDWLEAEQRIERAQQLTESHCWAEALEEIEGALAINSDNAIWHAQRGVLLEELDRYEEAAEAFRDSYALDGSDREIAIAYGLSLVRLERYTQALIVFEELAIRYPDFEPAYCYRINLYAELGRHEQAEQMFYLAQQIDDKCPRCFLHMGISLADRGESERAIFCYNRTIELDPDCYSINRRIAQAYRATGKLDRAREYYLREMRDDPGNTDLLYEIADMALEGGQLAAAAGRFAHILELDPDHLLANYALGKVWLMRGQFDKALECFETADTLSDSQKRPSGLSVLLGETLFQLGRFTEAKNLLTEEVEENPERIEAQIVLGNCQLAMDKPEESADTFRRIIALDGSHAIARHQLAVSLYKTRQYQAGLEHCLEALKAKPDFHAAMTTAAIGHLRLGEWRNARSVLKKALGFDPSNTDLQRLLSRLWWYRLKKTALGSLRWMGRAIT